MGWTGIPIYSSGRSNKEILMQEFDAYFSGESSQNELVDVSQKGAKVWFLCRNKQENLTWAMVVLCRRSKHELCYKEIELSEHPFYYDMPKKWLPMLSAEYMEKPFCKEWLAAFHKTEAQKKASKNSFPSWASIKNGAKFSCTFYVETNSGFKAGDVIEAVYDAFAGGLIFANREGYGRFCITKRRVKKFFSQVRAIA